MSRRRTWPGDWLRRLRAHYSTFAGIIRRALTRAFPERQILIRELDRMSIYRLSRGVQAATAAIAIVMSGVTIAIVIAAVVASPLSRPREVSAVIAARIEAPRAPAPCTETQHAEAAEVVGQSLEAEADEVNASFGSGEPASIFGGDGTASVDMAIEHAKPVTDIADIVDIDGGKAGEEAQGERIRAQLAAIDDRVFALATRGLGAPPAADDARAARTAGGDRAGVDAHLASIERHIERLATGVSALKSADGALLREFQPQLAYFIQTAERVVERAGLDLDEVVHGGDVAPRRAVGGPFVAAVSGPLAADRAALRTDLAYWKALRGLVRRMPLASPLDRYAISSSFGARRDPVNNRKAVHYGLDMTSSFGSSVRATAPGTVTFAGRNGGYGNFVEIDHGRSLRTRYAHLRAIKVKKGEKVAFMQEIGALGNTGRSTGAHLHYEILVAGKPVNPMNFIKAGQHVFQE
ncbi:MAG: M23 family metallopeptidase [Rhodospirillales bacterium]|nr:M23 family metallopeptidase [Rhodospirillales bacterium]